MDTGGSTEAYLALKHINTAYLLDIDLLEQKGENSKEAGPGILWNKVASREAGQEEAGVQISGKHQKGEEAGEC